MFVGLLVAPLAYALGFGEPELLSRLAQPLQVRVPLVLDKPSDLKGLQVKLSDAEIYKAFQLTPPTDLLRQARTTVREVEGRPYVYIESDQRNLEPYLGLLLEAQIEGVRVVREVSVLADPLEPKPQVQWHTPPATQDAPSNSGIQLSAQDAALLQNLLKEARARQAPSVTSTPAAAPAPAESIASAPLPAPAPAEIRDEQNKPTVVEPAPAPATTNVAVNTYGPIRPGQSISKIAQIVRTDPSINLPRMIAALVLANPHAFPSGPDSMLVGSVLTVPDMDRARSLPWSEVLSLVGQGSRDTPRVETSAPVDTAPGEAEAATTSVVEPTPVAEPATLQLVDQIQTSAAPAGLMLQLVENLAEVPVVAVAPTPTAPPAEALTDSEPTVDADTTTTVVPVATPIAATAAAEDAGTPYWMWAFAAAAVLALLVYALNQLQKRRTAAAMLAADAAPEPDVEPELEVEPSVEEVTPEPPVETPTVATTDEAPERSPPPIRLVRPMFESPVTNLQGRLAQLQREAIDETHKSKLSVAEAFLEAGETADAKELLDEVEALTILKSDDTPRRRV